MVEEFKKILKRFGPLGFFLIPIFLLVVVLFIILIAFGIIGGEQAISPFDKQDTPASNSETLKNIYIGDDSEQIKVEIADTPDEWETGLMYRTNLAEDEGMLFVFPDEFQRSFWMKNTYVSLDIIFINSNGLVLNFFESAEPLNVTKTYESSGAAKYVLELKNGAVKRLKISEGEKVNLDEI